MGLTASAHFLTVCKLRNDSGKKATFEVSNTAAIP